jgi:hypothetical protein
MITKLSAREVTGVAGTPGRRGPDAQVGPRPRHWPTFSLQSLVAQLILEDSNASSTHTRSRWRGRVGGSGVMGTRPGCLRHTVAVSGKTDPLLSTAAWLRIRAYWVALGLPCARCGLEIAYGAPRYFPGSRRVNGASLVVGHIVGRDQARLMGWSDEMINDVRNTQPEHQRCSCASGARYRNRKGARASRPAGFKVVLGESEPLRTSREW